MLQGLAVAALALVQCARQETDLVPEQPSVETEFAIFAPADETRTENDGLSTRWVSGDQFTLYHRTSGSDSFVLDSPFTVDDPATGHALGSVGNLGNARYDWAIVYPYAQSAGSQPVPVTVGCAANGVEVQSAYDATDHLAGPAFPLYGLVEDVDRSTVPTVPVRQLAAVVAV